MSRGWLHLVFVPIVGFAACGRCAPAENQAGAPASPPPVTPSHDLPDATPVAQEKPVTPDDPMAIHASTREELLALAPSRAEVDAGPSFEVAQAYIAPVPGRFNHGNRTLARHTIGPRACREGLHDLVLQTPEQRARCRGRSNMVPIYRGGDMATAQTCIDVFEYPNRACELPFVWGTPAEADRLCRSEGKRLCSQTEWTLACAGDPAGGADREYAYGDTLDLQVCNTSKPHPFGPDGETWRCSARTAQTAWNTCATETEPSGAFPRCRSRFGVFDLHGNVAEMMTRPGGAGQTLTQLKGSAFFYVDVARQPGEGQKQGGRETYPDHCAFDPRWHVETLSEAMHSSYHLGFRCCLSL